MKGLYVCRAGPDDGDHWAFSITTVGAITIGAAAAAAGSIVSQGLGVATGIQDKFSFKSVALAAQLKS